MAGTTASVVLPPPTLSTSTAAGTMSSSSSDTKASDTAILTQYPSSLVRLLVLLSPIISFSTQFVRLATWTAGPGTASHSFLLLLGWWAVCLYGYETIRYAPQAVLLSIILYNGLIRAFKGINKNKDNNTNLRTVVVNSEKINITIDNLSILADFVSTLSNTFIEPLTSLFTWQSFEETKAITILLITTWPIWLLCFGSQLWDVLGLPRIALQFRHHALKLTSIVSPTIQNQSQKGFEWGRQQWPSAVERGTQLHAYIQKITTFLQLHITPIFNRLISSLPASSSSSSLRITILPPFPLFSLSVRHLFLVLGTIALTWCSPWCALIRHALWRSAFVRQTTRKTISLFSGHHQALVYPKLHLTSLDPSSLTQVFGNDTFTNQILNDTSVLTSETKQINKDVTRHEDVIYQFTIFENQRWWMGLDWTAALLPQERPSWADESNNPVSPPSSFSLPSAKTTLKPSPTSSNPKAYVKRLVRWQWIDAEWTVAGRDNSGVDTTSLGLQQKKSRRASSTSSSTLFSGTLFSNSTTAGPNSPIIDGVAASSGDESRRLSIGSAAGGELPSDLQLLDVDAEGWQYGDNSWEKMSRKGGLGRYTRRRRWIRRAVLVEMVQKNYTPTEYELKSSHGDDGNDISNKKDETGSSNPLLSINGSPKAASASAAAPSMPTSPTLPSSPRVGGSGDLKQRLARAAQRTSSISEDKS